MEHAEIRAELNRKRLHKTTLEKNLVLTQDTIVDLQNRRLQVEDGLEARKYERAEQEKEEMLRENSQELESELAGYEDEIAALLAEKQKQMDHYSLDNIQENFIQNSPLSDEALESIEDLRLEACDAVSERFVNAYFKSLGVCRVAEEDFLTALDDLDRAKKQFFVLRDSKFGISVENFTRKLSRIDTKVSTSKEQSSPVWVFGLGVVVLVLSFFVYPIYTICLGVVSMFNVRQAILMKNSLDLLKVVEDNFKQMEKALMARAKDLYREKQVELDAMYAASLATLQGNIDEANKELTALRQALLADFVFDPSEVEKEVEDELNNIDHQITEQSELEADLIEKINQTELEIQELMQKYGDSLGSLEREYMDYDRIGDGKFYPNQLLLAVGDAPVFYKNPNTSTVFIYRDRSMMINFIRLYCLQLRCNVHPSSSVIEVWDHESSGVPFMAFQSTMQSDTGGFQILNTSDLLKESVVSLETVLQKRLKIIMVSYDNIDQYNNDMVQLGSVTESYYTIFVLSPDNLRNSESFHRLLVNGPDVGIYVHMFMESTKVGESWIPLLEKVNSCAIIQSGNVSPYSIEAIISKILEAKK